MVKRFASVTASHPVIPHRKHYVVIVLGLGEALPLYTLLTRSWERRYGIIPILHVVGWKDKGEPFKPKLSRLIRGIETASKDGRVSLIGISAGASAALNAYVALKKKGRAPESYISICGRLNFDAYPWRQASYDMRRSPAFEESVALCIKNQTQLTDSDIVRIACFQSLFDEIVPRSASALPQCARFPIALVQHHLSIYGLLLFPGRLITILKAQR